MDRKTGSILAEICHVKGERLGAARHDKNQTNEERQAFDNLILMCGSHHKIIDDNPNEYSVERLFKIKRKHESGRVKRLPFSNSQADRLIETTTGNALSNGSIVNAQSQRGGQAAHSIQNTHIYQPTKRSVGKTRLTTEISMYSGVHSRFQSPGLEVLLICKSARPARIRSAQICVDGIGFVKSFEQGFDADFRHDPPKGLESETLCIDLFELSDKSSPEGFILNRDDVCRFFLPMCLTSLAPFLSASPEKVFVRAVFFDGSEHVLLRGNRVHDMLKSLVDAHGASGNDYKGEISLALNAKSKNAPRNLPVGLTNKKPIAFVSAEQAEKEIPRKLVKIKVGFAVAKIEPTNECTIGVCVQNSSGEALPNVSVSLQIRNGSEPPGNWLLVADSNTSLAPQQDVRLTIPFHAMTQIHQMVSEISPDRYSLVIRSNSEVLARVHGRHFYSAIWYLRQISRAPADFRGTDSTPQDQPGRDQPPKPSTM